MKTTDPKHGLDPIGSIEARVDILFRELQRAIKGSRPSILLSVYSSEFVRASAQQVLIDKLRTLGQSSVYYRVTDEATADIPLRLSKFSETELNNIVFFVSGLERGGGIDGRNAYRALNIRREYFVDHKIRILFWLTEKESANIPHWAPDFWAFRYRVVEFLDTKVSDELNTIVIASSIVLSQAYDFEEQESDSNIQRLSDDSLFAQADAFQKSFELYTKLGDEVGQAIVLNSLGGVFQRQGKFEEAVTTFQRSYELFVRLEDDRGQSNVLNSLGGVLQRQGRFEEAATTFQRSYELFVRLEDDRGQAMVLNSLGGVLQRQGRFEEAATTFQKSYELFVRLEDDRGQAMVLNSLGGVLQRQGRFEEAVTTFLKSYELLIRLEDDRGQAMVLNSLGGALQRQGKIEEAVTALQKSALIEHKLGNQIGQAMVLNSLGGVLQRQGKFEEAVTAFQKSYTISERLQDNRSQAMVLNSLGGVLQRQGRFEEAVTTFLKSYELLVRLEDDRGQAMVLNSLGGALQRQDRIDEAIAAFQKSYEISQKIKDEQSQTQALLGLGKVYYSTRKYEDAVVFLQRGFDISYRIEDRAALRVITPILIDSFVELGQPKLAQKYREKTLALMPNEAKIARLSGKNQESIQLKRGTVKRLLRHPDGTLYGFIAPDDGGADIYFGESFVDTSFLPNIVENMRVEVDVENSERGPRAKSVRIDENLT